MIIQEPIRETPKNRKAKLRVSTDSVYEDMVWDFGKEIKNPLKANQKQIKWKFELDNGEKFSDPKHGRLMESSKDYIYSLMADAIEGRKDSKYTTLITDKFKNLRQLINWMVANGYTEFSQLDAHAINNYHVYHKNRKAKYGRGDGNSRIKRTALTPILQVVRDIYLQRNKLNDAITVRPFKGKTAYDAAGVTRDDKEQAKTPRIPDGVSEELLRCAFEFTEKKSGHLLSVRDEIEFIKTEFSGMSYYNINNLVKERLEERGLTQKQLQKMLLLLRTACYIVIAYFSGMRFSEVVSIKTGAIAVRKGKNGKNYYILHSTCYKVATPDDTWLVPECVVVAVDVMERLSEPLRKASGKDWLFLGKDTRHHNRIGRLTNLNEDLIPFLAIHDIGMHEGSRWRLTTHQFRKSFAYFMAVVNKCNLKFLQHQFKHVSMDMTLWYALTTDEDLKNEVSIATEDVYYTELEKVMDSGAKLAGAGGDRIEHLREEIYPGMTAKDRVEALKKYVIDSDETYVRSTFYNLCFYNAEHAQCNAGLDCQCNPLKCHNAVITEDHRENWEIYLKQNVMILSLPLQRLQKAFTQKVIDEKVLPVFKKMGWEYKNILTMKKAV